MTAPILTVTLNPAIDLNYTVDRLGKGDLTRATQVRRAPGGKGIVVSRMLSELGVESEAACLLGGPDAEVFLELAQPYPFQISPIRIDAPTRTNTVISESATGRQIKVNAPGPKLSARVWRDCERQLIALFNRRRWIVLGGGLPPGAPDNAYARLIRAAHKAGARVALDTSGAPLSAAINARPDLVKPNRHELESVVGRHLGSPKAIRAAAQEVLAMGASTVVVTNGPHGALALDDTQCWFAKPPRITELSPVGAGDCMLAGILAKLDSGRPLNEALVWGVACGAATAALPDTILARKKDVATLARTLVIGQFQ